MKVKIKFGNVSTNVADTAASFKQVKVAGAGNGAQPVQGYTSSGLGSCFYVSGGTLDVWSVLKAYLTAANTSGNP